MTQLSLFRIFELFHTGFLAPINSAKFIKKNKWLMFMSLAPHLIGVFIYFWFINSRVIPWAKTSFPSFHSSAFVSFLEASGTFAIYLLSIFIFSFLCLPIISILSSPIQDYISARSYEYSSGKKLPSLTFLDNMRLLLSECSKLLILLIGFTLSIFIPFFSPFIFLLSLWFFGWDHLDRCWSLKGLRLRQRLKLGLVHFPACVGLGLWSYIPFAGTVLGFVMTAAGAHVVGSIDKGIDRLADTMKGSLS